MSCLNFVLILASSDFLTRGCNTSSLTLLVGSFDPQKPSPKWPIMCLVGR